MKKVNLRDLYPDVYKNDHFVEVTEDVLETIRAAERAEAAYDRRMYRYIQIPSIQQKAGQTPTLRCLICLLSVQSAIFIQETPRSLLIAALEQLLKFFDCDWSVIFIYQS